MTQQEAINKVLALARDEIGYHEKASNSQLDDKTANSGSRNYTKYARDLDALGNFYNGIKQSFAYCDMFVDWLLVKSFGAETGRQMLYQPTYSSGAGCLYSSRYYRTAGAWVTTPQPGDQIFFSYQSGEVSHTGIVESVTATTVVTIEGNTSDQVARRSYNRSSGIIYGYGRPNWGLVANGASSGTTAPNGSTSTATATITPNVETAATYHKYGSRILKFGRAGTDVRDLQGNLIQLGYNLSKYGADGEFGTETLNAVKEFQRKNGLEPDGEVGNDTYKAIANALAASNKNNATTAVIVWKPHVGEVVKFTGIRHYAASNAIIAKACKPGNAKITAIYGLGVVKHPYHLIAVPGSGSTVYGWVDTDTIEKL